MLAIGQRTSETLRREKTFLMHEFRCGHIAVIGRPNVGKSTLINSLLGQKIAAVSPRPQTTRRRQLGILTTPDAQLIFADTPGLHAPRHKLGRFLNQEAREALEGADVNLWLVEVISAPSDEDANIASILNQSSPRVPLILASNKIDLLIDDDHPDQTGQYANLLGRSFESIRISAARRDGLVDLVRLLVAKCPARGPEYEDEQITDLYEREIAADLIREAALSKLRDEIPHSIAVRVNEFQERTNGMTYMSATVFVERESQKGIVIGEGGKMLKQIGIEARRQIESMSGRKVFLELRVKVEKNWRNDENVLRQLGYRLKR